MRCSWLFKNQPRCSDDDFDPNLVKKDYAEQTYRVMPRPRETDQTEQSTTLSSAEIDDGKTDADSNSQIAGANDLFKSVPDTVNGFVGGMTALAASAVRSNWIQQGG